MLKTFKQKLKLLVCLLFEKNYVVLCYTFNFLIEERKKIKKKLS